jgi:2-polyprenyl-3-methyl-5-hydroxy-6-metoxy-1,4-benzoquinol methylase
MMREISYASQTVESANPLARYAHRARIALALKLVERFCSSSATVVDFGSGPGLFLHTLGQIRPDLRLIGLDPYVQPAYPEIRYEARLDDLKAGSVDVLTALEVCEHLYPNELDALLKNAAQILGPDGVLIISVPIMYGASVIPKLMNWAIRGRDFRVGYTPGEILRSVAGLKVSRPENLRTTHKGFDFRDLRTLVSGPFMVEQVFRSPLTWLPWWMSSQYFMICQRRALSE